MLKYIKHRWEKYLKEKSLFSKISDLIFVLLIIGMLIPASRREISAFMARLLAGSPKTLSESKQSQVPEATYQWRLTSLEGKEVQFSEFRGKTIFLNIWATWCPPCIAEMPDIQDLYNIFGDQAAFLLVSDEDPSKVKAFMERRGFNMPVYIHRGLLPEVFTTNSIPITFVIGPNGNIVIRKTGAAKWNSSSMQNTMKELISLQN